MLQRIKKLEKQSFDTSFIDSSSRSLFINTAKESALDKMNVAGPLTRKSNLSRKSMQGKDHQYRSQHNGIDDDSTNNKS